MQERRSKPDLSQELTPAQKLGFVISLVLFFVPIILALGFPRNPVVFVLLGEGRIVFFWFFVMAVMVVFRKQWDAVVEKWAAKIFKPKNGHNGR